MAWKPELYGTWHIQGPVRQHSGGSSGQPLQPSTWQRSRGDQIASSEFQVHLCSQSGSPFPGHPSLDTYNLSELGLPYSILQGSTSKRPSTWITHKWMMSAPGLLSLHPLLLMSLFCDFNVHPTSWLLLPTLMISIPPQPSIHMTTPLIVPVLKPPFSASLLLSVL